MTLIPRKSPEILQTRGFRTYIFSREIPRVAVIPAAGR
ncbi:hypothetical protein B4135_3680 [Caldibacillus debilis]|uniref:Uncharacterized protein n=1 Tax=Caldibacillus debilis TaxID=301148 RepID=A0A150LBL2_9BACI|nr:hypothetical protein B4135_3680 [Caldibacillus debilis]